VSTRGWIIAATVVVGALLGLAVAGWPDRSEGSVSVIDTTAAPTTSTPGTSAATEPPTTSPSTTAAGTTSPPPATTIQAPTTATTQPATTEVPRAATVLVLNGGARAGAASAATLQLRDAGFDVGSPEDAKNKDQPSGVFYEPGFENDARAVAEALDMDPAAVAAAPAAPLSGSGQRADVMVVLGIDRR